MGDFGHSIKVHEHEIETIRDYDIKKILFQLKVSICAALKF